MGSTTLGGSNGEEALEQHPIRRRRLWSYLNPIFLAAVTAVVVTAFFAWQWVQSTNAQVAETSARVVGATLAGRVAEYVRGRRVLLETFARLDVVRASLEGDDPAERTETARMLERLLPQAIQVRLFGIGQREYLQPDPGGNAPMGFAGVDLVRRALQGKPVPAEIHQIASGNPYLALATPIRKDGRILGTVFIAWPLGELRGLVGKDTVGSVDLWLVQGGADGFVIEGPGKVPAGARALPVPETIWSLYFRPADRSSSGDLLLPVVAGAMLLVVLAVLYLQQRRLHRDLAADMAYLTGLGKALASERKDIAGAPVTALAQDASVALKEVLREQRRGGNPETANRIRDKAGRAEGDVMAKREKADLLGIEVEEAQDPAVEAPAGIFRAYDIRGLVDRELTEEVALGLGWAFGELARDNGVEEVFVAHDARHSSPALYEALCTGLAEMGLRVVELGLAPVALLYFAMHHQPEAAAVMVTGSHNPPEYNGFKLYLRTLPVDGDRLKALWARMREGGFEPRAGSRESRDLLRDYLEAVAQDVSIGRAATVVIDAGNGAAGEVACALFEMLGCEVVPLYCEPDGSFPYHHPDPGNPDNLQALRQEVVARNATLGLAFDGDGDRLGVVDDQGEVVRPEHVLMLLAADVLRRHPGSDVVFDVKSSRHLAGFILSQGGRPIMGRAGHTRMKEKMRETGALVGGEYSGHVFIKERWFGSDDAIYAGARLLEVVTDDPRPFHEQLGELPVSPATPELQLMMPEGQPQQAMRAIMAVADFPEARVVDLDGLRIEFADSWGLVRPSNTTPSLVFRFEADDEAALEGVKARFRELLHKALPEAVPPF